MSSLAIFRKLLMYIQGESHPLYVAERRIAPARIFPVSSHTQWLLFALLMIGILILPTAAGPLGLMPTPGNSAALLLLAQFVGGLVSLAWVVPTAILAGRAISRERSARTWDSLLVSPYPIDVIILAKAAASIRPLWSNILAIGLVISAVRIVVVIALMIATATTLGISMLWVAILAPLAMILILLEWEQEIALSVSAGILGAFLTSSQSMNSLVGGIAGGTIRLVQLGVCLWLLPRLAGAVSNYVALTSTMTGGTILLAAAPGILAVLIVIVLAVLREVLTRACFNWALRTTHEG